jgi:DNA-binding CsgD family transcriptional regulator
VIQRATESLAYRMGVTPERAKEMLRSKEILKSPSAALPPQRAGPRPEEIAILRGEVAALRRDVDELRKKVFKQEEEAKDHSVILRRKGLSPRQGAILTLVAKGMTNPEIGEALYLSSNTVRTHMAQIASRIGTGSRVLMAVRAVQWGLVDVDEPDGSTDEVSGNSSPSNGHNPDV